MCFDYAVMISTTIAATRGIDGIFVIAPDY
jgi:hypothetical protein